MFKYSGLCWLVPFQDITEPLGQEACLAEVGHWGWAFEGCNPTLLLSWELYFLSAMLETPTATGQDPPAALYPFLP